MDIFTQKKYLLLLVVLLVVLNFLSIGLFLWKDFSPERKPERNPPPRENNDVSEILRQKLNFTEKQVVLVKNLRAAFNGKEKDLIRLIRSQRDSMNVLMFNKNIDGEFVKAIARRISDNEYDMELLRYEQAREFKSICTREQLEKFEELVVEIRDYFKPDNKPINRRENRPENRSEDKPDNRPKRQ